jgi:DNA polymerase-3 subunit alpha
MSVLVIDTETTGLTPSGYKNVTDSELWSVCRIVQIAWSLFNPDGTEISSEVYTILPDKFVIPEMSSKIHGITNEIANQTGIEIREVFKKLDSILDISDIIVAHNMSFDESVILSEMYRYKEVDVIEKWKNKNKKCTMMMENKNNRKVKFMKLSDLYKKYFSKDPDVQLHRADNDVKLCADIYFAMTK